MLRLKLYSILFICGLVACFSSCQKELDDTGGNSNVSGNFKAKIDGTWWVADRSVSANRLAGFITLTGLSNDKKRVVINLLDSGVHHYTLDDQSLNVLAYVDSNLSPIAGFTTNVSGLSGGDVNITSIDTANKTMSGTFSCKVWRQIDTSARTFTEGSFTNIPYTSSFTPPGGSSSDSFHVKISGVLWNASVVMGVIPPAPYDNNLGITGGDATLTKTVALNLPSNVTPGTYSISLLGSYLGIYKVDNDPNNLKLGTAGSVTILEHNTTTKRVRGTFFFTASNILNPFDVVPLTEGYFSVVHN